MPAKKKKRPREKGRISKKFYLFLILLLALPIIALVVNQNSSLFTKAAGTSYYVDCVNGNDVNTGQSTTQSWKNLTKVSNFTFSPGDTIYLSRGCTWDGGLTLKSSGVVSNPITVTAYGTGNAPSIKNSTGGKNATAIAVFSSYNVIDGINASDTFASGVRLEPAASYNIVRNMEIFNTGFGIDIRGANNLITKNYVHDLHMINNTPKNVNDNDDYGAVGYNIEGTDNELSYNKCITCKAPSYDYGNDGGFVEVWNSGDNTYVHHNYAENTDGFFELGAERNTHHANNVRVAYNVIYNTGSAINVHTHAGDVFSIVVSNLRFENNTVVQQVSGLPQLIFPGSTSTSLISKNNIFYLDGPTLSSLWTDGGDITHTNNLYYVLNGARIDTALDASEKIGNPLFVNLAAKDFHLQQASPARDAGVALGYTQDFDNNPVPGGSGVDMGAFEYAAFASPTPPPASPSATLTPTSLPTATSVPVTMELLKNNSFIDYKLEEI